MTKFLHCKSGSLFYINTTKFFDLPGLRSYPFGLVMAGISSKAAGKELDCGCGNKKGYNGNEIQANEFSDGNGLDVYDFNARTYDQQIGRFLQIDPMADEGGQDSWTPYHYSYNNPILYGDPDGKFPFVIPFVAKVIIAAVSAVGATYIVTKKPINAAGSLTAAKQKIDEVHARSANVGDVGIVTGSPLGLTTGTTYRKLNAESTDAQEKGHVRNPNGSKGKPDHQEKVQELAEKAKAENPDKIILQEKKIQIGGSNRRPDVQVVDPKTGKTEKIYEAERRPSSQRNIKREEEYKRLSIPNETHKIGQ